MSEERNNIEGQSSILLKNGHHESLPLGGREGGGMTGEFVSNWDQAISSFDDMGLPEKLLRGIFSYDFEKPSAIQQRAIKPLMMGKDVIAQAQSGTVSSSIVVVCVVLFLFPTDALTCIPILLF
jgi:hypothetical protein